MKNECRNDHIILEVRFEKDEVNERVRLVWSVENISNNRIGLQAYYCSFYEKNKFKGVYVNGQWVTEERFIASKRIQTEIYPEESRTIVWGYVEPIYYGLIATGPWTFHLKLLYSVYNEPDIKDIECESNPIQVISSDIPERLGDITSPQVIEAIYRDFHGAIDSHYAREIENALLEPRGKARRVPDAILDWNNRVLLVLFKTFGVYNDLKELQNMVSRLENLAIQYELKIEGVIVAFEPNKALESKIDSMPKFHLTKIEK